MQFAPVVHPCSFAFFIVPGTQLSFKIWMGKERRSAESDVASHGMLFVIPVAQDKEDAAVDDSGQPKASKWNAPQCCQASIEHRISCIDEID